MGTAGYKKPPKHTQFKKGQVANPRGAGAHDPARRALKKLTIEIYRECIELALTSNIAALKKIAEDPNTPAVQVGIATALVKAISKGDWGIVNAIAERIVGKIPDTLVHQGIPAAQINSSVVILPAKDKQPETKEEG